MGQIAYQFDKTLFTMGSAQAVAGTLVLTTNAVTMCNIVAANKSYQAGFYGVIIHLTIALSGGATPSSIDVTPVSSSDGSTFDDLPILTESAITLATGDLDQAGTTLCTVVYAARDVGPVMKLSYIRTAGDRTIAITTKSRLINQVQLG